FMLSVQGVFFRSADVLRVYRAARRWRRARSRPHYRQRAAWWRHHNRSMDHGRWTARDRVPDDRRWTAAWFRRRGATATVVVVLVLGLQRRQSEAPQNDGQRYRRQSTLG